MWILMLILGLGLFGLLLGLTEACQRLGGDAR